MNTKEEIVKAVREMDPKLKEDQEEFKAALVMLSVLTLRSLSQEKIVMFTGVLMEKVGR